jgi:hypothetical protein
MLYAAVAREARRRGFQHIISYTADSDEAATLASELGTSLKAAGWVPEHPTRGGSWNRPSRPRRDAAPTCPKVRWGRSLSS